jgi:hypothetical protein
MLFARDLLLSAGYVSMGFVALALTMVVLTARLRVAASPA